MTSAGSTSDTIIGSARLRIGSIAAAEVGDHCGTGGSAGDLGPSSKRTVEASLSEEYPPCRAAISSKVGELAAPLKRALDLKPLNDSTAEITKRSS